MESPNICPEILLIDDGELDNVIFKLVIKKLFLNTNIETAANGSLALAMIKKLYRDQPDCLPDYIFLDLRMPVMDGWEFLREYDILEIDPLYQSKIYILSSSIDQQDITRSFTNPRVEEYLPKPINLKKLKSILHLPRS